jgi:DNA-binding protein HU-beta
MNKSDLIEQMAKKADITKAQATRALDAYLGSVKNYLRHGGHVSITGFGIFKSVKRNARMGRNPRTGAVIKIKASRVPVFKPGKNLKEALN